MSNFAPFYYDTPKAANRILASTGTLIRAYEAQGHYAHIAPLVMDNGELGWRASLVEAIAKEIKEGK